MDSINKISLDKKVVFNNKYHTYHKGEKKLISVTTLLSKFKNEFDSDYWSKVIAKRENKTQDEILSLWKEKAFKSTEIGTAIHQIFEDYTLNKYSILNDALVFDYKKINSEYFLDFTNKSKVALKFIDDFFVTKRIVPIHSEYIVYNDVLAGQIDMICKDSKDNFYIIDFKTNEKIDFESYKSKKMLGCFDFVDDSSYWHYCIQLSIYKNLLKKYDIRKLFIIHITAEKYHFIECEDILEKIKLTDITESYYGF